MASMVCNTSFFESSTLKNKQGGAPTNHPDPEKNDLGEKLAFFGHFLVKNGFFLEKFIVVSTLCFCLSCCLLLV